MYYDRKVRDIVRYEHGEKHEDFHVPTTVADYRAVYKAYLHDPDIQDARAYFPFVTMWDNHEFSWQGWQSLQNFGKGDIPAQTRKVCRHAGLVRDSSGAGDEEKSVAGNIRSAGGDGCADHGIRRERIGHRAEQYRRGEQSHRLSRAAVRKECRTHHDRSALLSLERAHGRSGDGAAAGSRIFLRRTFRSFWMPAARQMAASRRRRSNSAASRSPTSGRISRRRPCWAPRRKRGSSTD